jgi:glycosyltransferase involved in cell wall biosynthesis
MVSIVIPAHNEEAVIERCQRALPLDSAEVVVVCNAA